MNFHPWAKNALISDPYNPPPAALSVERAVIDLAKMEVCDAKKITLQIVKLQIVGRSHPRQRVFIPADLCERSPIQV